MLINNQNTMKTVLSTLSLTLLLLLLSAIQINAQNNRTLLPLDAQDFKCMKTLDCVQSSESLKDKGWSYIFDDSVEKFAQELTAMMEGENVSFFAVYDKEGYLIKSVYKRKNMSLPPSLLVYLVENNPEGLKLTGTSMTMHNFDESTITYEVVLQNGFATESKNYDIAYIEELTEYQGLRDLHAGS